MSSTGSWTTCGTSVNSQEAATFFYQDWDVQKVMTTRLCKEIWPQARGFELELISDWSCFNRVIGIDVTDETDTVHRYVLRAPHPTPKFLSERGSGVKVAEMVEVGNCAATLKYLEVSMPMTAPRVVCFDKTDQNGLQYPYVIMTRIPGKSLCFVLRELNQQQMLQLATEMGHLLRKFQSCQSPLAGTLEESDGCESYRERGYEAAIGVVPLGALRSSDLSLVVEADADTLDDAPSDASSDEMADNEEAKTLTAKEILIKALERRTAQLSTYHPVVQDWDMDTRKDQRVWYEDLKGYLEHCFEWDWIDDEHENCLFHTDLYPRNIMVDPEATPMIQGIVDWDDAVFLPKFMSCEPPLWLLKPDDGDDHRTSEQKLGPAAFQPLTPDLEAIMKAFNEAAGEDFTRSAYNPRHALLRAIGRLMLLPTIAWNCVTFSDSLNCEVEWRRLVDEFADELGLSFQKTSIEDEETREEDGAVAE